MPIVIEAFQTVAAVSFGSESRDSRRTAKGDGGVNVYSLTKLLYFVFVIWEPPPSFNCLVRVKNTRVRASKHDRGRRNRDNDKSSPRDYFRNINIVVVKVIISDTRTLYTYIYIYIRSCAHRRVRSIRRKNAWCLHR